MTARRPVPRTATDADARFQLVGIARSLRQLLAAAERDGQAALALKLQETLAATEAAIARLDARRGGGEA